VGKLFVLVALVVSPVLAWLTIGFVTNGDGGASFVALAIAMPSLFTLLGGTLLRREAGEIALGALGSIFVSFGLWLLTLAWLAHEGVFDN
jgi:hypothetical protein